MPRPWVVLHLRVKEMCRIMQLSAVNDRLISREQRGTGKKAAAGMRSATLSLSARAHSAVPVAHQRPPNPPRRFRHCYAPTERGERAALAQTAPGRQPRVGRVVGLAEAAAGWRLSRPPSSGVVSHPALAASALSVHPRRHPLSRSPARALLFVY